MGFLVEGMLKCMDILFASGRMMELVTRSRLFVASRFRKKMNGRAGGVMFWVLVIMWLRVRA